MKLNLSTSGASVAVLLVLTACAQMPLAPNSDPPAAAEKASGPAPAATPALAAPPAEAAVPAVAATPAQPESPAQPPAPVEQKSGGVGLGGMISVGIQNWTKVGDGNDPRLGLGLDVDLFVGLPIGGMKLYAGPHFGMASWSADYSHKANSATDSVSVTMQDVGATFLLNFGDTYFQMGAGSSTLSSAMVVSGQTIEYPFSGKSYGYKSFGIGFRSGNWVYGLGGTLYDDYASSADRVEFKIGFGFL